MDSEIQLISDGDGLAVIGDPAAVERFLLAEGLPSTDLGLHRLRSVLGKAGVVTQGGSEIAANSGRWMKLTEKSAKLAKTHEMMQSKGTDLTYAVVRDKDKGRSIKDLLQFHGGPRRLLNPANVGAIGVMMAQVAMQQTIDEILDYLATIDKKVDDVLRAQKDAVLADMLGVDIVIDEAMTIREHVGRVSEVAWSKVQSTPFIIARTQAYALSQLDALADQAEHQTSVSDLAKATKEAESKVQDWLTVLAQCFRLQDAIAVLEFDRLLDSSPDELNRHRRAVRAARQKRIELISQSTGDLLARMDTAGRVANAKVLLHPMPARAVVGSGNQVAVVVVDFQERLGIERDRQSLEARRWSVAATDVRDQALKTGKAGVDAATDFVGDTISWIGSAASKVTIDLIKHKPRRRENDLGAEQAPTPIKSAPIDPWREIDES